VNSGVLPSYISVDSATNQLKIITDNEKLDGTILKFEIIATLSINSA